MPTPYSGHRAFVSGATRTPRALRRCSRLGILGLLRSEARGLASALAFVALFPTLRFLTPRLSTEVQSLLVWAGAVATWLAVAWYCYHRGNFLGGWILAFAPVFAHATNLIVQVAAGPDVAVLIIPAVAAAAVSVLITGLAYLAGRGCNALQRAVRGDSP